MYSLCPRGILSKLPGVWKAAPASFSRQFYATDKKSATEQSLSTPAEDTELPPYCQHRLNIWTELKKQSDENVTLQSKHPIKITLLNQREIEGETWTTTPLDVARKISHGLQNTTLIARVNGELWDLERPFETDSVLEFLRFTEPAAQVAFWRSSSFILSEALERAFGGLLCEGTVDDEGFHCDIFYEGKPVSPIAIKRFKQIEDNIFRVLSVRMPFERLQLTKAQLLEMFSYNKFKIEQINKLQGDKTIAYRCGSFIDICDGPLVRVNQKIKPSAFELKSVQPVNWNNQKNGDKLERIYAISFPSKEIFKEWKTKKEKEQVFYYVPKGSRV